MAKRKKYQRQEKPRMCDPGCVTPECVTTVSTSERVTLSVTRAPASP